MKINLEEIFDSIDSNSLDDLVESLYEKVGIPIALFNSNGEIITISNKAELCKCSFTKFNKESQYCSLFAPFFTSDILEGNVVDKVCDNKSRISTKIIEHNGNIYHITLYQYLLEADVEKMKIEGIDLINENFEKKYQWIPTILTIEQRETLFNFISDKIIDLL